MGWVAKKHIYKPEANNTWMVSHAQTPVVDIKGKDRFRIYFGTRNSQNQTITTFIEVDIENPENVLYVHDCPILSLGRLGCFDDSGAMPSCLVDYDGKKYLYYTGWNVGGAVPFRNSIGFAVSEDGGYTFRRPYEGPILDRIPSDPYFCGTPYVLVENGIWRMWYLSGVEWKLHAGKPEPYYHIKYAESRDGIQWERDGIICIDLNTPDESGLARPSVIKDGKIYRMWYSYRSGSDYRSNRENSYRIGYAESSDGVVWLRKDDQVGIDVSDTGWDSEMIAYPFVIEVKNKKYMFYNGNGFGKSGFGYAILDQ